MTSTKQAKIKTKHKFWTISILKSKGGKKRGKKMVRVRRIREKTVSSKEKYSKAS